MSIRLPSFAAQAAAAAAAAGLALLPLYVVEGHPQLAAADDEQGGGWNQQVWLVTRSDVRRVGRVRYVADRLSAVLAARLGEGRFT